LQGWFANEQLIILNEHFILAEEKIKHTLVAVQKARHMCDCLNYERSELIDSNYEKLAWQIIAFL